MAIKPLVEKTSRMAVVHSVCVSDQFNTEVFERLRGEDSITKFKFQTKICVQCNFVPFLANSDRAFLRRILMFPFDALFVDSHRDLDQKQQLLDAYNDRDELEAERKSMNDPGFKKVYLKRRGDEDRLAGDLQDHFFSWIVDGAIRWYAEGIVDIPESMSALKTDTDVVGRFIEDIDTDRILTTWLHNDFKRWYEETHNKTTNMSIQTFTMDLKCKQ